MVSRFLALMALSCCVCGLEVNVAHSSYEAEEKQSVTLAWTFKPKPDPDLKDIFVYCDVWTIKKKNLILIQFQEGVEISRSRSKEFSGRVQWDKDILREGWIRLRVSSLRTEDSGRYMCWVNSFRKNSSDKCWLNVTAARTQTGSKTEPQKPDSGSPGWIGLYWILGLTAAAVVLMV